MQWREKKICHVVICTNQLPNSVWDCFFYYKERHYRREKEERNFVYDYISRKGTIICTECNVLQDS